MMLNIFIGFLMAWLLPALGLALYGIIETIRNPHSKAFFYTYFCLAWPIILYMLLTVYKKDKD